MSTEDAGPRPRSMSQRDRQWYHYTALRLREQGSNDPKALDDPGLVSRASAVTVFWQYDMDGSDEDQPPQPIRRRPVPTVRYVYHILCAG